MTLLTQEKQAILHIAVHRKGQAVKVLWKFDKIPDDFDGFVVVGNPSHYPTSFEDGVKLLSSRSDALDTGGWKSNITILPKDFYDVYFRVFLNNNRDYEHIQVRYHNSTANIGKPGLLSLLKWTTAAVPSAIRRRRPDTVVCPHCWKTFHSWQMRFCFREEIDEENMNPPINYPLPNAVWARYNPFYHMPVHMPKGPGGKLFDHKMCPYCIQQGNRTTLPYFAGSIKNVNIGLIGSFSGKTTYMVSLLQQLIKLGYNLHHPNDSTIHHHQKMSETLFNERRVLHKTHPLDPQLIYLLKTNHQDYALTLCDAPGEFFGWGPMVERTPYLKETDGLILLIDPPQYAAYANFLGGKTYTISPRDIFNWLVQEFRINLSWLGNKKIPIPIAIAFSKADVLKETDIIDPSSLWHRPIFHEKKYDFNLHHNIDATFGVILQKYDPPLYAAINANFQNFAFFGVSATGCSADEKGIFPKVEPFRVEDPLLWILHTLGVIHGE